MEISSLDIVYNFSSFKHLFIVSPVRFQAFQMFLPQLKLKAVREGEREIEVEYKRLTLKLLV